MKVLLDHNLPAQLQGFLSRHPVWTAREMGWETLKNGTLMRSAEESGFTVLITGDQNLFYQQNNAKRSISLVVVTEISLKRLAGNEDLIVQAVERAAPGSYELIKIRKVL